MTLWSDRQLELMRSTWNASLGDTCQVGVYSAVADSFGQMIAAYTYGDAIACGFEYTDSREVEREPGTIILIDAKARLAHGTSITHRDRIKLTHRYSAALVVAQTFEVVGYPHEYVAGIVIDLREVR